MTEVAPAFPPYSSHAAMQVGKLHVLLVEDSNATAGPIIAYLTQGGHRVTHVTSGEAAVEAYATDTPDMVLMDVVMPGMGGIEATRRIKAIRTEHWVPLIMTTGLTSADALIAGLEAGADDYMLKPLHLDVLEARMRSMQRIVAMQTTLAALVDHVIEGIVRINSQGMILTFNHAAERIFGYEAREVLGQNVNMLMPSPYAENHDGYVARYLDSREPRIIGMGRQVVGRRKDGQTFPMHLGVTEIITPDGQSFIGLVRDISREVEEKARVEHMAWHDPLTDLPNRAELWRQLQADLARDDQPLALLFVDLDGFKLINDGHGHGIGDNILRIAAERLRNALAHEDMLARVGGDEFIVLLRALDDPAILLDLAGRLIVELSRSISIGGQAYQIGASIGIARRFHDGTDAQALVDAADAAMYQAKKSGRGRAVLASPGS